MKAREIMEELFSWAENADFDRTCDTCKAGDPEPKVWFHDIFRLDGTPYSQEEVDFIREMTGVSKK